MPVDPFNRNHGGNVLDSDDSSVEKAKAVAAAKSRVGKAIKSVGQEAIQIHGGIAMTEELDVGHLFKREPHWISRMAMAIIILSALPRSKTPRR